MAVKPINESEAKIFMRKR